MHPMVAPDVEAPRSKEGNNKKIEQAVWVIVGLASVLATLRIAYHIFRGRRRLWTDDYFLIAALVGVFLLYPAISIVFKEKTG